MSYQPAWQVFTLQTPPSHEGSACGGAHGSPQALQLLTSVDVSMPSSICLSQSLSSESQISTPPLVGRHSYSQPSPLSSSRSALMSRNPTLQSYLHSAFAAETSHVALAP